MAKIDFEEFKAEDFAVEEAQIESADESTDFVRPETVKPEVERSQAVALLGDIENVPVKSTEFTAILETVENFGLEEVRTSTASANGILMRSTGVMSSKKGSNRETTLKSLAELRSVVDDLAPPPGLLSPVNKVMKFLPGGNKVRKYIQKHQNSQAQLDGIVASLNAGQDNIQRDNAEIMTEKEYLAGSIQNLAEKARIVKHLNTAITEKADELERAGRTEHAVALRNEVLHAAKQRRQDLTTQMAVSLQAYMSLDLIYKNNKELAKGVDRAKNITVTALRNAVVTAAALDDQKKVIDKLTVLKSGTESLMLNNAQMLKDNTVDIHKQATEATIDPAVLEKSFQAIQDTFQAIDDYKKKSGAVMDATTKRLESQMDKAQARFQTAIESHTQEKQAYAIDSLGGRRG